MIKSLVRFFEINSPLLTYSKNVYSQTGEDGIIERIFQLMPPKHKFCVEFGAWDGKHLSNCCNLLTHQGWGGVMIEADPVRFKELQQTYAGNDKVVPLNRYVDFEGENSLSALLEGVGAPTDFDVLSIDIDGCDFYVWDSLRTFTPSLVIIEFNPTIPNDVLFVQDKSFEINHGCSLLALIELGRIKGYELIAVTPLNALFVRKEDYPRFAIPSNFICHLFTPTQDGRIFQGYDSTIHTVGMDRLQWHESQASLSSEDFQVLPKSQQIFRGAQRK
jgi:hypothetical protein